MSIALPVAPAVRRARGSVSVIFLAHGAVYGSFATRIPWLAEHVHATPGTLGIALVAPSIGAITTMPLGARLIHRFPGRPVMRILIVAFSLALVLPALAPSVPVLFAALFLHGVAAGLADITMNAQGVLVERRYGRSIMSGLHGLWSAGGLIASAIGAAVAHAGIDARAHFAAAALVLAGVGYAACAGLPDERLPGDDAPAFAVPSRAVLLIGLVGFCAIFAEGSSGDWSAVFLRSVTGADPGTAAAAFTAFALAMTIGRLSGDHVVRRFGAVRAVRGCGIVATVGGLLVLTSRVPAQAMVGFACIGLGVSIVVPLAFAAAGRAGANPAQSIAGVATIAYGAGLAAPGAIGGIAQASSLPVSFAVITAVCGAIALGAGALRPRSDG